MLSPLIGWHDGDVTSTPTPVSSEAVLRRRDQRAWYVYDWANSGFFTTTMTALYVPYMTAIATRAACPTGGENNRCSATLNVLGLDIVPGSIVPFAVTATTLISAIVLPFVGVLADRTAKRKELLAAFAWIGAAAASAMFFVSGTRWQLGLVLMFVAVLSYASAQVVYTSIMPTISTPDERDRVSTVGWGIGYLGGGLLLAFNLVMVTMPEKFGWDVNTAVRYSLLSAGLWWALFTIPVLRMRNRPLPDSHIVVKGSIIQAAFGQLLTTLRETRTLPQTLLFLLAFLIYNDGIQTVIAMSSLYGQEELGFQPSQMIQILLLVQFVAFFGALAFGWIASRVGAKRTILMGLIIWTTVAVSGYVLPAGEFTPFLVLGALIGLVMGGTQALSRSAFSQLIPPGKEAEYFALYQAGERGMSWTGTLLFGAMFSIFESYRPSLLSLIAFFVIGGMLLLRVDMRKGISDAGNEQPELV